MFFFISYYIISGILKALISKISGGVFLQRFILNIKKVYLILVDTVTNKALKSIDIKGIESIGIGKYIEMKFDENMSKDDAKKIAEESCKKMLVNPNTETYSYILED